MINKPELNEEEQEFLHMMYKENFDFDKWADELDFAIENEEISTKPPKANEEIEFDLDDLF